MCFPGFKVCCHTFNLCRYTTVPCYFGAPPGDVTRDPWRDVNDHAHEPEAAGAGSSAAAAEVAHGFASFDRQGCTLHSRYLFCSQNSN
jgi:hypothetical protein